MHDLVLVYADEQLMELLNEKVNVPFLICPFCAHWVALFGLVFFLCVCVCVCVCVIILKAFLYHLSVVSIFISLFHRVIHEDF